MTDGLRLPIRIGRALRRVVVGVRDWLEGRRSARDVIRSVMQMARFRRWGVRPITQRRFIDLVESSNDLVKVSKELAATGAELYELKRLAYLPQVAALRVALDAANETIAHLRRTEERAQASAQGFVNEVQHLLFETRETTAPGEAAAALVADNAAPADAIATLVNLSESLHGARAFQYIVPLLGTPVPFPLSWPEDAAPLRVVDVGSQELADEADIHAPLRAAAPVTVIGFDPFTRRDEPREGPVEVRRPDGGVILTYPHLIADGAPVRFHINRYEATSSILPTNHRLTRPFGLLDRALETVEERSLPSRRLDDILADAAPIDLLKIDVQGASHDVLSHGLAALGRTLVCHVEVEFAEVYAGERMFGEIDLLLRKAGFDFVDFHSLGRQRYASFEASARRTFHRGRTLWGDAVYVRGLDTPRVLTAEEMRRAAWILHCCYNKQDIAAELLGRCDALTGGTAQHHYLDAGGTA